jgi:hypothetical protein
LIKVAVTRRQVNSIRTIPLIVILLSTVALARGDTLPPGKVADVDSPAQKSAGAPFSIKGDVVATLHLPPLEFAKIPVKLGNEGPQQIGIARKLPQTELRQLDGDNRHWHRLADGRSVLTLAIESPPARALRIGLRVERLPAHAILRFGAAGGDVPEPITVLAGEILQTLGLNYAVAPNDPEAGLYWSPLFESDYIRVELELPKGVEPSEVDIKLAELSHFYAFFDTQDSQLLKLDLGLAGDCNNDVMCATADRRELARSTARIIFQDGVTSFLCSGSLVNDRDPTQGHHFVTANHCINDQLAASSIEFHWLFRSSACDSTTRDPGYTRQTGGAILLSTLFGSYDTTLLRLNHPPPAGVSTAGWDTRQPFFGESLHGIHHPQGDWQKISFADAGPRVDCYDFGEFLDCAQDPLGHFFEVDWTSGIVEAGSSGSGIFSDNNYLLGTLSAGDVDCGNPLGSALYASFADAYVAGSFAAWLMAEAAPTTPPAVEDRARNLSGRGLVQPGTPMHGGIVAKGDVKVLITARGPTTGLTNALADTTLELAKLIPGQPPVSLVYNDDWLTNNNAEEIASLTSNRPLSEYEAALLVNLAEGSYTGRVRDYFDTESGEVVLGFTLVDDQNTAGSEKNLSTRGLVEPQNPIHGGIVVEGEVKLLITLRGPSTGLGSALSNPRLVLYELRPGQSPVVLGENNDWGDSANAGEIASLTVARPLGEHEAAMLVELKAGSYTAVASDQSGTDSGEVVLGLTLVD